MIYVSADDLWELRIDHVFHPNAPRPPVLSLSILPQFNSMGLGRCGCKFKSLIFEHTLRMMFMNTYVIAVMRLAITLANVNQCRHMASQGTIVLNLKLSMIKRDVNNPLEAFNDCANASNHTLLRDFKSCYFQFMREMCWQGRYSSLALNQRYTTLFSKPKVFRFVNQRVSISIRYRWLWHTWVIISITTGRYISMSCG